MTTETAEWTTELEERRLLERMREGVEDVLYFIQPGERRGDEAWFEDVYWPLLDLAECWRRIPDQPEWAIEELTDLGPWREPDEDAIDYMPKELRDILDGINDLEADPLSYLAWDWIHMSVRNLLGAWRMVPGVPEWATNFDKQGPIY